MNRNKKDLVKNSIESKNVLDEIPHSAPMSVIGLPASWELTIEWRRLSSACDDWLFRRLPPGWIEIELVDQDPGAFRTWRLWQKELGELGKFTIRNVEGNKHEIYFSGLGFRRLLNDEQWASKRQYMRTIINSFVQTMNQDGIFRVIDDPAAWRPWEHIPDTGEYREIIKLWCEGNTAEEIAAKLNYGRGSIYNIVSYLRSKYPDAEIPWGVERKRSEV